MNETLFWSMLAWAYCGVGFLTLFWTAYRRGQRHVKFKHGWEFRSCPHGDCDLYQLGYAAALCFWWIFLPWKFLRMLVRKVEEGGVNSALPPKGSVDDVVR
jgi:hypothetical protein